MQHKALAPRQLAHSPFTPVKVMAKIQLDLQTLPHLRVHARARQLAVAIDSSRT